MSLPESSTSPVPEGQALTDLRKAVESLRTMFHLAALCGIILSAVIYAFLYKQTAAIARQNEELRGYVNEYNTNMLPRIEMVRTNLEAFAKSNTTIEPLMKKYFPPKKAPSSPTP